MLHSRCISGRERKYSIWSLPVSFFQQKWTSQGEYAKRSGPRVSTVGSESSLSFSLFFLLQVLILTLYLVFFFLRESTFGRTENFALSTSIVSKKMGPPRAKDEFILSRCSFFLPSGLTSLIRLFLVAPVCMMLLNFWWVTREIEASAARVAHITVDHKTQLVTWLLHASNRDLFAVGEVRTHVCGCTNVSRHRGCPYHVVVDYFKVLAAKLAECFHSIHRNLPLFPSSLGANLLKKHVIEAYRTVIKTAGIATTKADALGVTRQRFGGHVTKYMALRTVVAQQLVRCVGQRLR